MQTVALVNESKAMDNAHLQSLVNSLQVQVSRDFAHWWNIDAILDLVADVKSVPADAWVLGIFDDSDQAGALGYHDITSKGLPLGKAFVATDMKYGYNPDVTISHELLEMLADPKIGLGFQFGAGNFAAYEVCDPCEADKYGYDVNGHTLSDFLLPNYFSKGLPGPYDFRSFIKKPLTLLPGGYISIWTGKGGWTQKTAKLHQNSFMDVARVGSRRERRNRHSMGAPVLLSTAV